MKVRSVEAFMLLHQEMVNMGAMLAEVGKESDPSKPRLPVVAFGVIVPHTDDGTDRFEAFMMLTPGQATAFGRLLIEVAAPVLDATKPEPT